MVRSSFPSAVTLRSQSARLVRRRKNHLPRIRAQAFAGFKVFRLSPPQLDAADFAGDRFRQFGEFEPAYPLERRERVRQWRKIDSAVSRSGVWPGASATKRLRHRKPQRVGRRHHGGLGHCRVLDQYALELERADAIVGGFKDVIGAADIGQVAVVVDARDVAGAIDAP